MTKNELVKEVAKGILKKGKIKRKQMFNQLKTINEQKINRIDIQRQNGGQEYNPDLIQEQSGEIDEQRHPKLGEKSVQEVCQAVNRLMAKNKVGIKNAFDVPIINLLDIMNYNKDQTENSWKNLSATLENDYKIYGYRVDAIHSITYSILNIMSRRENPSQNQDKNLGSNQKSLVKPQNMSFLDLKQGFLDQMENAKTFLQRDHDNINISSLQKNFSSDPMLQRTKRFLDEPGLNGMLTNNIRIGNNLELPLQSRTKYEAYSMKMSIIQNLSVNIIENPLKMFESVEKIKLDISKILKIYENNSCSSKQLQKIWANVKNKNINISEWSQNKRVWLDVEDPEYRSDFQIMIDQNSQNHLIFENSSHSKFIGDFLKKKNPLKKISTYEDIFRDSEKWLNDIDKKFLGMKTHSKVEFPLRPKQPNLEDVIFDLQVISRDSILMKQTINKQIKEQIQDRFLTTIRPMNEFKMQQISLFDLQIKNIKFKIIAINLNKSI